MKKNFKSWTIKIEENEKDYRYAKIVARTITDALNWVCLNCECELDDITWVSAEAINVVDGEE